MKRQEQLSKQEIIIKRDTQLTKIKKNNKEI